MVRRLHFSKEKGNKWGIIIICLLGGVIFLYYLFTQISLTPLGTDPEEVLNYTYGMFIIIPRSYISFQDYYALFDSKGGEEFYSNQKNSTFETPKLEFNNKFYDYEGEDYNYYTLCKGKKVEINFTNPEYSEFQFNYKNVTFYYQVNLYSDLYHFSDKLKGQDCYFNTNKYTEGFLEDPYNNKFIEALSKDFITLKSRGYSNDEIVEIATLFVQSIPYGTDYTNLNRYPYETIFEKEGNCLDKSLILTEILRNLNYTSYIILGNSEDQYHALVGVICSEGNVQYEEKEICFIETTAFMPITSDIKIDIEEYLQTSEGHIIYSGESYGKELINYYQSKDDEIKKIESQIDPMELDLKELEDKMCDTGCKCCEEGVYYEGDKIIKTICIDSIYCDNAYEYNRYVREYNKIVEDYNLLVQEWYKIYYDIEESLFNNVELVERN